MADVKEMEQGAILVVDDAPLMRDMIADALIEEGYTVLMAEDGADAFAQFENTPGISFVISDMEMPVLDGMGLIKKLRGANYDVPIVVLTGNKDVSSAMAAIHAGADDYLLKDENIQGAIVMHTKKIFEKRRIVDEMKKLNEQLQVRNQFIKKTFGRYMSDEVVEKLLESPDGLKLGGESLLVTIVMTDLRGFSAISEKLPPEEVVMMLNSYLETMTDIIFKYSGTINEIIGDAILILFGAPTQRPDDADRAIACALEMQIAMEKVNQRNRAFKQPDLEMGIGINTGKVVAGNIGSDMRVKYAVVGSNVNLAGRVESFTVGGQVLITESTLNATSLKLNVVGEISVPFKGLKKPVNVYDITGASGTYNIALPQPEVVFVLLNQEVPMTFEILDGKYSSGDPQPGRIIRLAEKSAIFYSEAGLTALANLKVIFADVGADSIAYAKVTGVIPDEPNYYEMRFTFVPQEIKMFFDEALKA